MKNNTFKAKLQSLIQKEQDLDAKSEQYQQTDYYEHFTKSVKKMTFKTASELLKYSLERRKRTQQNKKNRRESKEKPVDSAKARNKRRISEPKSVTPPKHTIQSAHDQIKAQQLRVKDTKSKNSKVNKRYVSDASLIKKNGAYL